MSPHPGQGMAMGLDELPRVGPAAITLGVFDGVHRGHRALLDATARVAREQGWRSAALVFDPHPDEVLRPGTRVPRLAPLPTVLSRITDDVGVDHALAVRFDDALRALTAELFLASLAPSIELRAIVMSPESAFGRGRGGTVDRLREIGDEAGFAVVTVDPVLLDDAPISSMRIRQALDRGAISDAARFGYPPGFTGRLRHGAVEFDYLPALPRPGRYRATLAFAERSAGATAVIIEVTPDGRVRIAPDGTAPDGGGAAPAGGAEGPVVIELLDRA